MHNTHAQPTIPQSTPRLTQTDQNFYLNYSVNIYNTMQDLVANINFNDK